MKIVGCDMHNAVRRIRQYAYSRELNNAARPLRRSVRVAIAALNIRSSAYSDRRRRARVTAVYTSSRYYRRALAR